MDQHPIPQQITSYEFKLVGEMTLKQFLKAAAGFVLAILINSTKLVSIIKWPLMLMSGGIGLLLAFVPLEDRPLEVWIVSFIRSIYSPTMFTYKKRNDNGWLNLDLTKNNEDHENQEQILENKNLFVSVKKDTGETTQIKNKKSFELGDMFGQSKHTTMENSEIDVKIKQNSRENNFDKQILEGKTVEVKNQNELEKTVDWKEKLVDLNLKKEKLEATGEAVFGAIPMPNRPELPNIIVGMATNWDGKIIDGVIVEIQDEHGVPSRVIKTNSLGQFKISTPLADGRYLIIAEKEGYNFDRVNVDLTNQIVEPIRIIAHN